MTRAATLERDETQPRVQRWLFDTPTLVLVFACYAATVALYGWRADGTVRVLSIISRNIGRDVQIPSRHLYLSPLGPWITNVIGMPTWHGFALLQIVANLTVLLGGAWVVARCVNDLAGRLFVIAFFCSPEAQMSTFTYGRLDVVTIGASTVFMVAPAWLCFPVAVVAAAHHFEQVTIALVFCVALRVGVLRQPVRPLVTAAFGVLIGKLLVTLYLSASGIAANGERAQWLDDALAESGSLWHGLLPVVVFSVFHVLWIPVLWMGRELPRRDRLVLVGVMVAALMVTLATFDLTRVYANLTWPVVVFAVIWFSTRAAEVARRYAAPVLAAAFLVPRVHVFAGEVWLTKW